MGLLNDTVLDTVKSGNDSRQTYFRIPRNPDSGFIDQYARKHINFPIELWYDYDTRLEVGVGKKPIHTIQFRAVNGTHEEIFGSPGIPAVFDGEGNRIAEAIPAKIGVNSGSDMFTAPYDEVYDDEAIDDYVVAHAKDIEEGKPIGRYEATARAYVTQTYSYLKTLTDFCGIDMTTSTDRP